MSSSRKTHTTNLPYYYSNLVPFQAAFRTGAPVLAYHHVACPRRDARVKWLYVDPKLFTRQIRELRAAGFSTPKFDTILGNFTPAQQSSAAGFAALADEFSGQPYSSLSPGVAPLPGLSEVERDAGSPPRVYLTFDDGYRDVFQHALPLLLQNRLRGMLYLVSDLLGKSNEWQLSLGDVVEPLMDVVQVREWLEAGLEIGSHTQTHPHLTQLSIAAAREEVTASKKSLEDQFGIRVDHFCYTYGERNKAVRDLVVEAGYKTACTVDPGVNTTKTSPFELNRFIARKNPRNLKTIWNRLCKRLGLLKAK